MIISVYYNKTEVKMKYWWEEKSKNRALFVDLNICFRKHISNNFYEIVIIIFFSKVKNSLCKAALFAPISILKLELSKVFENTFF